MPQRDARKYETVNNRTVHYPSSLTIVERETLNYMQKKND